MPVVAQPAPGLRSRWGLYAPFAFAFTLVVACAAAWGIERARLLRVLDAAPAAAARRGADLMLTGRDRKSVV